MRKCLIFIIILFLDNAYAEKYIRAEIYYYDYIYDLRVGMSPSELRERYLTKLIINDSESIKKLIKGFPIEQLQQIQEVSTSKDVRLVLDLYNQDNVLTSYHADRFYFYDSNGNRAAKLRDSFSEKFRVGAYFN